MVILLAPVGVADKVEGPASAALLAAALLDGRGVKAVYRGCARFTDARRSCLWMTFVESSPCAHQTGAVLQAHAALAAHAHKKAS
jgi:hypothetical protein